MAIGWLTVIQNVPWGEVVKNAPLVAEGARKLWHAVTRKPQPVVPAPVEPTLSPQAQAIATLQTRVASLESGVAELNQQMLASSEVIKALAEQNTQLIARIQVQRVRLLWLVACTGSIGLVACYAALRASGA
jgi:hypothetical protein